MRRWYSVTTRRALVACRPAGAHRRVRRGSGPGVRRAGEAARAIRPSSAARSSRCADGVWVAVGFSDANSVLIDGEGGSIVVDTTSDVADAREVKAEFAKRSAAPVRAIIYDALASGPHRRRRRVRRETTIPRFSLTRLFVDRVPDVGRNGRDGGDQFGIHPAGRPLHQCGHRGCSSGDGLLRAAYLAPTRTFSGRPA